MAWAWKNVKEMEQHEDHEDYDAGSLHRPSAGAVVRETVASREYSARTLSESLLRGGGNWGVVGGDGVARAIPVASNGRPHRVP